MRRAGLRSPYASSCRSRREARRTSWRARSASSCRRCGGQPVIIENRAGAGGNVGAEAVAKSPNDGYTLLMGTVGTHAINAALFAQTGNKMPFDPVKDFVPITLAAGVPNVMVDQSEGSGKQRQRIHRVREGKPRQAEHGIQRQRHVDPSDRRAVQDDDRHVHGALAVSRLRTCAHRPDRRQHRRDVRQPAVSAAAHQGRQAKGAGGHIARALAGAAQCADD